MIITPFFFVLVLLLIPKINSFHLQEIHIKQSSYIHHHQPQYIYKQTSKERYVNNRRHERSHLFQTYRHNNDNEWNQFLQNNPLTRIFYNIYSYFYWLPKKNMPYVIPFDWVKNSSLEFIAYYQFPQNLPPYIYLDNDYPDDFFCYGLPGATLPLGNWDPFGFHQVSYKVVKKYRESELKHGRIAMLATIGFLFQEIIPYGHVLHPEIGGMAITHMEQLQLQGISDSFIFQKMIFPLLRLMEVDVNSITPYLPQIPLDYLLILSFFISLESFALVRNWTRWKPNEYNHQFDHNFGIGNLKDDYVNGDYGFDPLRLLPSKEENPQEWLNMQHKELNHGRLAMIAFVGLIVQEYVTGIPSFIALKIWIQHILEGDASSAYSSGGAGGEFFSGIGSSSPSLYAPASLNEPSKFFSGFVEFLRSIPKIFTDGDAASSQVNP